MYAIREPDRCNHVIKYNKALNAPNLRIDSDLSKKKKNSEK